MSQTYRVLCLSVAASPISHMSGTQGNEAIIAREPVATPRGVAMVPTLSGNALRHRCVRAPGAEWLVREYGLAGRLTLEQLNYLFHGGALTEGGGRENTRRIADMQRIFPLSRLLGGCLPDQILAGSLLVGRGVLVCEENRPTLEYLIGGDGAAALPTHLRPAESFVSGYQYTRSDAAKTRAALISEAERSDGDGDGDGDGASNLMIFAGQAVTRGAAFLHDFTLPNVAPVELGALLLSLRLWQAAGGTIGGQSARGHGRLETSLVGGDFDQDEAVAAYVGHARSVRDEAAAWLDAAFARRPEKPAKGKPRAKAAAAASEE